MKANNSYEFEVYSILVEDKLLRIHIENIEELRSQLHDLPTYGTLTEEQCEENSRIWEHIAFQKSLVCKRIREIRRKTRK